MISGFDIIQIEDFGKLYVSSDRDDWTMVKEHNISLLIDLDGDLDKGVPTTPNELIYIYYPILDEDLPDLTKLHSIARFAANLCRHKYGVLAHCQLGLNRSALLIGVILTYLGLTGEAALTLLRSRRPGALFNDIFAQYLISLPANVGEG